ncbi:Hypothetical_protein [Hexamita inflata]|uniref:Hypothetical_protein n=1 Tax=Hexamita inflata TaxID=28002 RepID=A0AA86TI21_9EUKA|nr:Hypothetical protein HINF_LOCUS5506 [Hexamita inflata]
MTQSEQQYELNLALSQLYETAACYSQQKDEFRSTQQQFLDSQNALKQTINNNETVIKNLQTESQTFQQLQKQTEKRAISFENNFLQAEEENSKLKQQIQSKGGEIAQKLQAEILLYQEQMKQYVSIFQTENEKSKMIQSENKIYQTQMKQNIQLFKEQTDKIYELTGQLTDQQQIIDALNTKSTKSESESQDQLKITQIKLNRQVDTNTQLKREITELQKHLLEYEEGITLLSGQTDEMTVLIQHQQSELHENKNIIQKLNFDLDQSQIVINKMNQTENSLQTTIKQFQQENNILKIELQSKLEELSQPKFDQSLNIKLDEQIIINCHLNEQITIHEANKLKYNQEILQLTQKASLITNESENLKIQLQQSQAEIDILKLEQQNKSQESETQLHDLRNKLQINLNEIQSLKYQLSDHISTIQQLKDQLILYNNLNSEATIQESKQFYLSQIGYLEFHSESRTQMQNLELQINELNNQINDLKESQTNTQDEKQTRIQKLTEELQMRNEQLCELSKLVQEKTESNKLSETIISNLESQLNKICLQQEKEQQEIKEMKEQILIKENEAQTMIETLKGKNKEQNKQIQEQQTEIALSSQSHGQLKKQYTELEKQLEIQLQQSVQTQVEIITLKQKIACLEDNQHDDLTDENKNLKEQITQLTELNTNAQNKHKELQKTINLLNEQVLNMQDEVQKRTQQLIAVKQQFSQQQLQTIDTVYSSLQLQQKEDELQTTKQALEHFQKNNKLIEVELDEQLKQNILLKKELKVLQMNYTDLELDNASQKQSLEAVTLKQQENNNNYQIQAKQFQNSISNLKTALKDLAQLQFTFNDEKVLLIKNQLQRVNQQFLVLQQVISKINQLSDEKAMYISKSQEIQNQLKEKGDENTRCKEQQAKLQLVFDALATENTETKEQLELQKAESQNTVDQLNIKFEAANAQIQELKDQNARSLQNLSDSQSQVIKLQSQLQSATENVKSTSNSQSQLAAQLEFTEILYTSSQILLKKSESQNAKSVQEITQLKQQALNNQKANSDIQAQFSNLQQIKDSFTNQINEYLSQIQQLNITIQQLNEQLNKQVLETNNQMQINEQLQIELNQIKTDLNKNEIQFLNSQIQLQKENEQQNSKLMIEIQTKHELELKTIINNFQTLEAEKTN